MSISLVQSFGSAGASQNTPTTQIQTFTEPIAEGSLLVCMGATWTNSSSFNTPTDTAGNTWRVAKLFSVFQLYTTAIWYVYDSLGSAAGNVVSMTATGAGSPVCNSMHVSQWAGIQKDSDPLDVMNFATNNTSSTPSVSLTTTSPGGLILGWTSVAGPGGGAGGSTPGSGFSLLFDDKIIDLAQYQIQVGLGSVTITTPPAEGAWQTIGCAFKALAPSSVLYGQNT
jgi:hypothetical protein